MSEKITIILVLFFRTVHAFILSGKRKKKSIIILSSLYKYAKTFDDEKKLSCAIHDYNQTKCGVDIVDQYIHYYTVRQINRRRQMVVFQNVIDIGAINAMTIWLRQISKQNMTKTDTRRMCFLVQLSKALTHSQNERCSQESRLISKVKLVLLSLGYSSSLREHERS